MKSLALRTLRRTLARSVLHRLNRLLHRCSLWGLGMLNYEDRGISGEAHFLRHWVAQRKRGRITVVDVGANVGSYSREVRTVWPESVVHAIEPHPRTFEQLTRTARLCHFQAINAACGERTGDSDLYDYGDEDGSSHASMHRNVFEALRKRPSVRHRVASFMRGSPRFAMCVSS